MAIKLPGGFEILNLDPIDSRITVATASDRFAFGSANIYEGLIVYQRDTNEIYALTDTGSYTSNAGWTLVGTANSPLNLIATGSITASVDTNPSSLFLIKSGSTNYLNISSSGNVDIYSNLFIVKNFTTQQPVLTVSQSIVQFATQSVDPSGTTLAGSIWFTSTNMYIGLD